jgi:hypothetical protein
VTDADPGAIFSVEFPVAPQPSGLAPAATAARPSADLEPARR